MMLKLFEHFVMLIVLVRRSDEIFTNHAMRDLKTISNYTKNVDAYFRDKHIQIQVASIHVNTCAS
jgi:hypothetical protein